MAKIISFQRKKQNKKEKSEDRSRIIDYREQIKNHRFTILYRSGLIVALVLVLLLAWYFQWKHRTYTDCLILQSIETETTQNNQLKIFSDKILAYGKDGATCMDVKGNAVWNITYEMQNPQIVMSNQIVTIGDFNSRIIYIMDAKGPIGEITTTMPIYKFCVSDNGVVAVTLNDTDVTWIYLYDSTGKELAYFKTTMQKSGYPLDITISPNGQLVGVSFLYLDNGTMKTNVAFYNFGDVGQNKTDNYVSGYIYDSEVVPCLQFMDGKTAFAVSDSRLMFYTGGQVPVSMSEHFLDREVLGVFHNEEYVALVYVGNDPDYRYEIDIYDRSGTLKLKKNFNVEYKDIILKGKYIYIYNETKCYIFTMDDIDKYDGNFEHSAMLLVPSDKISKMTVVSPNAIDNLELK